LVIGEEDEEAASSLWLDHLAPGRPWSSGDFFQRLFQKDDFTANQRDGTRIRKIVDQGANFDKISLFPTLVACHGVSVSNSPVPIGM
jgi:hypothetical protein